MPSATAGNNVAALSIAVYSVVVGAYVVLRFRKAADRTVEAATAGAELERDAAAA